MKFIKAILVAAVVGASLSMTAQEASAQSAYCEGYQSGYRAGHCYQQFGCIPPIPPICPIPRIGESSFEDGYNRGFIAGLNGRR